MHTMRVRLVVHGDVQQVFFRQSAKKEADKLGLGGWVRNNSDGTVESVAEGKEVDLEQFITWCNDGPSYADVERVDVEWQDATGDLPAGRQGFKSFEIL